MPFEKELEELKQKKAKALQMGGSEKVKRQHEKGKLTAREKIEKLFDPGSFLEVGMLNHSDMPGMEDKTPADSGDELCGSRDRRQRGLCRETQGIAGIGSPTG
jgi:acetyl-CoA carboxylase carboxyltransferase component